MAGQNPKLEYPSMKKLTAARIADFTKPGRYRAGGNLYLRVRDNGARNWTFYYRFQGKMFDLGIGTHPDVGLKEARAKADEGNRLLRENKNPKTVWSKGDTPTFGAMAELYLTNLTNKGSVPRHLQQVKTNLVEHCGHIASMPVSEITVDDVLTTLKARKPEGARHRLRIYISGVWDMAQALEKISPDRRNPAAWKNRLSKLMDDPPEATPHAAMPHADVPAFLERLRELRHDGDGTPNIAAHALEFLIRCGNRRDEVRLAKWSEFNLDQKFWLIPAERMRKAKKRHAIPLGKEALAIIKDMEALRGNSPFVFPGSKPGRPLTPKVFERLLARMKCEYVTHGFRSSLRTWLETTSFDKKLCAKAIAHVVDNKVEKVYIRLTPKELADLLRPLFEAWDAYLAPRPGNVVKLRTA
jgi:integrase